MLTRAGARPTTSGRISRSATGVADAIAGLDIGQTIAVKSAAVVAVEAMEGTDPVIARAGQLAGARRADHQGREAESGHAIRRAGGRRLDDRGDAAAGATVLSVDAGKTLMIDGDAIIRRADDAGIASWAEQYAVQIEATITTEHRTARLVDWGPTVSGVLCRAFAFRNR